MLKQKQRLVETLRSQLEQGKMTGGLLVEKEGNEKSKTNTLIKASAIQPPTLPNGLAVKVKKEVEVEDPMEGVTEEAQAKKQTQPMQCSQETLLRLQQIHRLQAEQQKLQPGQKVTEAKSTPQKQQQQKKEAQILLQQQRIQQLIIQQTKQKQLQAEQKLAQQKLAQQKLAQQRPAQQNHLKQTQGQVQQSQQKNQAQLKQVQVQIQNQIVVSQKPAGNPVQQRKQLKAHQRKHQTAAATTQQVNVR